MSNTLTNTQANHQSQVRTISLKQTTFECVILIDFDFTSTFAQHAKKIFPDQPKKKAKVKLL